VFGFGGCTANAITVFDVVAPPIVNVIVPVEPAVTCGAVKTYMFGSWVPAVVTMFSRCVYVFPCTSATPVTVFAAVSITAATTIRFPFRVVVTPARVDTALPVTAPTIGVVGSCPDTSNTHVSVGRDGEFDQM
jgi:hypothetical protein